MKRALFLSFLAFVLAFAALAEPSRPLSPVSTYVECGASHPWDTALASPQLEILRAPSGASSPAEARKALASLLSPPPGLRKGCLVGTEAGSVFWRPAEAPGFTPLFSLDGPIHGLSMTAPGDLVAAVTASGSGYLWRQATQRLSRISVAGLGEGKLAGFALNADGSLAIATLEISGFDESWYVHYLVDMGAATALRSFGSGRGYGFTPDGRRLLRVDFDYEHKDEADHPYDSYSIASLSEEELGRFSQAGDRRHWSSDAMAPEQPGNKFASMPSPISADFALGWSEFGLETLTYRKKNSSTGEAANRTLIVPGPRKGLDLTTYRGWDEAWTGYDAGFRVQRMEGGNGDVILRRTEGETWERRVHIGYSESRDFGAGIDPDNKYLAILMPKPRPSADFTEQRTELHLRVLDWQTGATVQDCVVPSDLRPSYVREVGRDLEYILLATAGASPYCLFWAKAGTYRSWDGQTSWDGDSSASVYRRGIQGGLLREGKGGLAATPAAPGQVGSVVEFAIDPTDKYLAAIDEAGTFFLRDLPSGRTLLASPMQILPGYAVRPSTALPLSLSGLAAAPPSSPPGADPVPASLPVLHILKAKDFHDYNADK